MKNRIKELREKENLTQEQLAREMDVSRQTIISIEVGRYKPSLTLAYKLARRFSCCIEEVFDFSALKGEMGDE